MPPSRRCIKLKLMVGISTLSSMFENEPQVSGCSSASEECKALTAAERSVGGVRKGVTCSSGDQDALGL